MLPVLDQHRSRPLTYPALWKAFLCFAAAFVLHPAERLIGVAAGGHAALSGAENRIREVDRDFAATQL